MANETTEPGQHGARRERPLDGSVALVTGASRGGAVLRVADLAKEYGFTDIDGRQVEAFELD